MADKAAAEISVKQVIEAVETTLERRRGSSADVDPDTRLEDLGLNSLDYAEVFLSIQEIVGFELDPDSAGDVECVRDLARLQAL